MTTLFLRVTSWLFTAAIVLATVVPASLRPTTGIQHDLEHFTAFAVTGTLFALAYPGRLSVQMTVAAVFTLSIELMQIPIPTRHARLEDFAYDTAAVWAAVLLVHAMRAIAVRVARN